MVRSYDDEQAMSFGTNTYKTYIDGSTVVVRDNTYNTAMLINSSGNVTIGASALASTTTKLYVNGTGHYAGDLLVDGEVSALVA